MIEPKIVIYPFGDMIYTSTLFYGADVRKSLRGVRSGSVQCVVTSPPYWGLRQYLPAGSVMMRKDLTDAERVYVEGELRKAGVL
mgnify:CR=1 FL=1